MEKTAAASVTPVRQRTQFTCMAASLSMALGALGIEAPEDEVNEVMGCAPMRGASWEDAIAAAQHYGCRATLVTPATVAQLKAWTDAGTPVLIAWNPEGREWSHASCVFDVVEGEGIYVADPNIPDPDETVRVVPKAEFYAKWSEKWPRYLVRRPALAIEREITPEGRQVLAGKLERRRNKDRNMSRNLKFGPPEGSPDDGGASSAAWAVRKERGQAGLPGAGRAGPHKSVNDYDRKREKSFDREAQEQTPHGSPLRLQRDYGAPTPMTKMTTADFLASLDDRTAKFEEGKSMTVDEVADVVGPEFKEMNEDPPQKVVELKEEMKDKKVARRLMTAEEFLASLDDRTAKFERGVSMTIDEVAAVVGPEFKEMNEDPPASVLKVREEMQGKTAAAGGLYGFTRDVEGACTGACNRLGKAATRIARALYGRAADSPSFLTTHAKRARSKTARMLLKAMEGLGPTAQLNKTAAKSGTGLYGYPEKTARLALQACAELRHEAGLVAGDLHTRRAAQHDKIVGFLTAHAKTGRCAYSAMLAEAYPDAPAAPKTAADFLASEEGDEDELEVAEEVQED